MNINLLSLISLGNFPKVLVTSYLYPMNGVICKIVFKKIASRHSVYTTWHVLKYYKSEPLDDTACG